MHPSDKNLISVLASSNEFKLQVIIFVILGIQQTIINLILGMLTTDYWENFQGFTRIKTKNKKMKSAKCNSLSYIKPIKYNTPVEFLAWSMFFGSISYFLGT